MNNERTGFWDSPTTPQNGGGFWDTPTKPIVVTGAKAPLTTQTSTPQVLQEKSWMDRVFGFVKDKFNENQTAMREQEKMVQETIGIRPEVLGAVMGSTEPLKKVKAGVNLAQRIVQKVSGNDIAQEAGKIKSVAENFWGPAIKVAQKPEGLDTPALKGNADTALEKFRLALREAPAVRAEQEALYTAERSKRAADIARTGSEVGGEAGYFAQLGKLRGALPKADFDAVRKIFNQDEIDSLFNRVEETRLLPFEKITAKTGLSKLFDGSVPTNNEIRLLKEVLPSDIVDDVMAKRPLSNRLFETIGQVLNIPRSVMASVDLSAPLRQGVFMIGKPKQFIPAFADMFRFAGSEKAYDGLLDSIKNRSNYELMRKSKLAITDLSDDLSSREEMIMSSLPEKIPGLGRIIRGSNRAYSGFLNKLRADVFDDLVNKAKITGKELSDEELEGLGKFINSATGRGTFGAKESLIIPKSAEKVAGTLNAIFFSPRLMASRLNLLNPIFYTTLPPYARKEALKSLLAFTGTMGTILGLAGLTNQFEIGKDPRSADFGKIKVDNTRYDILGGFQQYIRLASQLLTGEVVSSTTGNIVTLGEGYKPLTRKDIIMRFFENKESPIATFVTGLLQGTNTLGEDFNVPTEVVRRMAPMVVQDLYELSQEKGAEGVMMGLPAIFGLGSQTYGTQELVSGTNKIGQPTMEVRPVQDFAAKITDYILGDKPLESSQGFNVEAYYDQLSNLPREEAAEVFDKIMEANPALAEKIVQITKERERGITNKDRSLKNKGVASGDRALSIKKELDKLTSDEERGRLWDEYTQKGVITEAVAEQLNQLYSQNPEETRP